MSTFPKIQTAIPRRRYQYGDYAVSVLGDVQSSDVREYQYVCAFVKEGETEPCLFIVAEHLPPGNRDAGSHALRVINSVMDEAMDVGNRWARLDEFVDQALQMGSQMLGLEQETPYQLM